MKTAKEWAASVVAGPECDGIRWAARLDDEHASAWFETEPTSDDAGDDAERARAIIERLVERVQADARAPLEEEIARLRAENERLNAEHAEYREFIAGASDMRAEEHEQIRKENQ